MKPVRRVHARTLFNGQSYSFDQVLVIENGVIIAIDQELSEVDCVLDGLVAPGYVDLQVNGGGGVLFNAKPCLDSLKIISNAHASFGTTGMLPTVITDDVNIMLKAANAVAEAIAQELPGIIGIHFEGPHISVKKKGAHSEKFIRPISEQEWQIFARKDLGHVLVTLAPEVVPIEQIKRLVELGVKVCIGHSNADYLTVKAALDAGASGFTHLFNAMSPISARQPGVTGCALTADSARCGLIVDGHHVDFINCQLALRAKPKGGIFLVTDAMPPVGTDATEFDFFDRRVLVENGKLTSTTGELAGSSIDMASLVRNCHRYLDITLDESIRMASQYPQDFLQGYPLDEQSKSLLSLGKKANFVQLNSRLDVQSTWIKGIKVFSKQKINH